MNAPTPLAYMITWTCYGTRLHGDARGTVDRHHNVYGTPVLPAGTERRRLAQEFASGPAMVMTSSMRSVVRDALIEYCDSRLIQRFALSVRTNHVHVVCEAKGRSPDGLLNGLKARGTTCLRMADLFHRAHSPWTAGGSTRYLWTREHLFAAMKYVLFEQGPSDEWTVGLARRDAIGKDAPG